MKLRSLSPTSKAAEKTKDGSNLTYDRLDVAKSVLVELRGKHEVATARARKRPPPPPPPPQHAEVKITNELSYSLPLALIVAFTIVKS